jgi:hypothetical protein
MARPPHHPGRVQSPHLFLDLRAFLPVADLPLEVANLEPYLGIACLAVERCLEALPHPGGERGVYVPGEPRNDSELDRLRSERSSCEIRFLVRKRRT